MGEWLCGASTAWGDTLAAEPGAELAPVTAQELLAARPHLTAHAFDGLLLEGVPLAGLAHAFGTPSWVYGGGTIRRRFARLRAAMPNVTLHYAVKANDHLAILRLLSAAGAAADVVSGGELRRVLAAGISPDRVVFSGVGKTADELAFAVGLGIGQINIESAEELDCLAAVVAGQAGVARIALRVNPDIDAGTHEKIATGRARDKFGIPWADVPALYARAASLPGIEPIGLAVHIGSQIFAAGPYAAAYRKLAELVVELRQAGLPVDAVDCGGGLGVPSEDEPAMLPEAWAATIDRAFGGLGVRLSAEPGRWLVASAGVLLARVIRTRRAGMAVPLVILDAAMNDLLRPALYGAWHGIVPVGAADLVGVAVPTDIAGPVCESGDIFARGRMLAPLADCALVAILDAGAYGAVMSSTYNARPYAAALLVEDGRTALIRARQLPEAMWSTERIPDWLAA